MPEEAGGWGRISAALAQENPARHALWIRPLRLAVETGERLELAAPSRFHASYVQTHLAARIEALARAAMPGFEMLRIAAAQP